MYLAVLTNIYFNIENVFLLGKHLWRIRYYYSTFIVLNQKHTICFHWKSGYDKYWTFYFLSKNFN